MSSSFNSFATSMMDALGVETRKALLLAGTRITLQNGELLQSRGTQTAGLVVVLKGHVRLMIIGIDGTELLTAILGPGQQFNEVTLFAGAAQTHDVEAVGETELLVLSASEYERFSDHHPDVIKALLMSNVHRMHQFFETLNDFRALPKSVVVARLLFKNARGHIKDANLNSAELDITQDDIAMFMGVSRAYLNKVLAKLSDHKLIELSYRKIKILDLAALEQWIYENLNYDPVDMPSNVPLDS